MMFGNVLLIFSMFLYASAAPHPDVNIKIDIKVNGEAVSDGSDNGSDQSDVKCGVSYPSPTRIVNGSPVTNPRKYSWQVGLSSYNNDVKYMVQCGGSVITNKHILTAAHCVAEGEVYYIGIGSNKQDNTSIIIPTAHVKIHKNFGLPSLKYDIAIFELSQPIDLVKNGISPICIPTDDTNDYVGINATVTGWGSTIGMPDDDTNDYVGINATVTGWGSTIGHTPDPNENSDAYPNILQEAQIPVLSNTNCEQVFESYFDKTIMLCAGDKEGFENGGMGTCSGDSGGPLTVRDNGQYQQIGIVSGGYGCAAKGNPTVFARVTYFLDWIKETVAPEQVFTASKP